MTDMSIALLVMTDGRDEYLERCMGSIYHLDGRISEWWIHDDTGDDGYRAGLVRRYQGWRHIGEGPRRGCAGAYQHAWRSIRDGSSARFVCLVEQDFEFIRTVDLHAMCGLLDDHPELVQVALRRQPWNDVEAAAGGIVESHPDWYEDKSDGLREWLEHSAFFTTNPCVFRRSLMNIPWPRHTPGCYSEGTYHQMIKRLGTIETPGPETRYAYWGNRCSGVWTHHIGHKRVGKDY